MTFVMVMVITALGVSLVVLTLVKVFIAADMGVMLVKVWRSDATVLVNSSLGAMALACSTTTNDRSRCRAPINPDSYFCMPAA